MKIVKAGYQILTPDIDNPNIDPIVCKQLEVAGRTCYKSEDKITDESGPIFVDKLKNLGHEAMIEHACMTIKWICDRGVSHELVRHRLASFGQESTRYCNYSKDKFGTEITVIHPVFFQNITEDNMYDMYRGAFVPSKDDTDEFKERLYQAAQWYYACKTAESAYMNMLSAGASPQEARSVLPNSLKTEVVMTANMREWRHFFKLRAAGEKGKPHPQMLEITVPCLNELRQKLPTIFGDIKPMEV